MGLTGTDIMASAGGRPILNGASLTLNAGDVLGLDGISGAGKSTLARILAGHVRPQSGYVRLDGSPLAHLGAGPSPVQYAPQSAELACDPRWRVRDVLCNGGVPDEAVLAALEISPIWAERFPHELSGGELARVSLARLLGPQTRYVICDEITAQLDALAQARLWQALLGLAKARGLGILVISHDSRLRGQICKRSITLRDGKLWTGSVTNADTPDAELLRDCA